MGRCKFQNLWLNKNDPQGYKISDWGEKHSNSELLCKICDKIINISSNGFQAIIQHSNKTIHINQCKVKLNTNQLRLLSVNIPLPTNSSVEYSNREDEEEKLTPLPLFTKTVNLYNVRDKTTAAELMWCMKCVAADYSFASCSELREIFLVMFGDAVPQDFSLGRNKAHYLITDALAPYFKKIMMKDIEESYVTLLFDETTNAAGKKELQVGVRYWSPSQNRIVYNHLETFFLGAATAPILVEKLNSALNNASVPAKNILMLESDSPNVNKSVKRIFNEQVLLVRKKGLLNLGFCDIHTIHNAFLKGLEELGEDASELIFDVHNFFHKWPGRWEDYSEIQRQTGTVNHKFIKHCPSRWLTIQSSAERLLEQWKATEKYFLTYVPKHRPNLMKRPGYLKIVRLLKKSTMKSELNFVISSSQIFTSITGFFQKEEPLIHLLHYMLSELVMKMLGRICKLEVLKDLDLGKINDDFFNTENLLPLKDLTFSDEISTNLKTVGEKDRTFFCHQVQKHFSVAIKHIVKKSSVTNPFLKRLSCLDPNERLSKESCQSIVEIARAMPWQVQTDILVDEWKLLQLEKDEPKSKEKSIDLYWSQFFIKSDSSGKSPRFPTVEKVIKASLSLSHGNADVERGFSTSGRTLTNDRASMSERTLNALITVKSALKRFDNKPYLIPITEELLSMGRMAYKEYNAFLGREREKKRLKDEAEKAEEDRKIAEEENKKHLDKKRKNIADDEEKLKKLRKEEEEQSESAAKLLFEANERLKKALKEKDVSNAFLAQAMLEGVTKVQEAASEKRRSVQNLQVNLEKRKTSLISDFFKKK